MPVPGRAFRVPAGIDSSTDQELPFLARTKLPERSEMECRNRLIRWQISQDRDRSKAPTQSINQPINQSVNQSISHREYMQLLQSFDEHYVFVTIYILILH